MPDKKRMGKDNLASYILAIVIVIGFFGLIITMMLIQVPETSVRLLDMLVGALIASFTGVVNYFFGSSSGSRNKDVLLHEKKP